MSTQWLLLFSKINLSAPRLLDPNLTYTREFHFLKGVLLPIRVYHGGAEYSVWSLLKRLACEARWSSNFF